ncbi:CotO family spore coat protein [Virgibacillus ndiopensis]|uniref:CotO family spore coat protein n=1 Tax=Virgibacillus ndiopensis TaxID=2004408 RepID=UPI000C0709DC|nr:CotO family spore coat protein [Virgibacillus ndiopensis]
MAEKKLARSPLLYIHQPNVDIPEAKMQYDYMTPKAASDTQTKLNDKQIENEIQENNEDNDDEEDKRSSRRAKFKEMTIDEKIDYFVNMPSSLPKMKCEVKTGERSYRGIINDKKEDDIFMLSGRRRVKIAVDEIEWIRLLGF